MIEVSFYKKTSKEVPEIVEELRQQGLVQGRDFDFEFHQTLWENYAIKEHAHSIFKFYSEKYATLFAIRYSS